MTRKRYADSLAEVLQDRPQRYRLRYEWVPVRHSDRYEDARLLERVRQERAREWLLSRSVWLGALLGGLYGGWCGFQFHGPQGAVGGSLIGMILGGLLGILLLLFAIIALLGGAAYGVACLVF